MRARDFACGLVCMLGLLLTSAMAEEPTQKPAAPAAQDSDRGTLPKGFRYLSDEETAQLAKNERDDSGAIYKYRDDVPVRKEQFLGRQNFLSKRGLVQLLTDEVRFDVQVLGFRKVTLSKPVEHAVVGDFSKLICSLAPDDNGHQSADLLYLDFFLPPRHPPPEIWLRGHTVVPWFFLFAPGGNRLVTCSDDGSMRLWDLDSHGAIRPNPTLGLEIAKFPAYVPDKNGNTIRGDFAAISPYGRWLATVYEHKVSFRTPKDGAEQFSWEPDSAFGQRIMALRFDPNGNNVFAFLENAKPTKNPSIKFWRYTIGSRDGWPFEGTHGVVDGRATIDEKFVITWDGSPEIAFWDVAQHKEIAALKVAPEHVYDVAVSAMGDVVATAGDDGEVKFWKIADRSRLDTKHPFKHDGVDRLNFFSDGEHLATYSDDGWMKVWDSPDFFVSRHRPGHWGVGGLDGTFTQSWTDSVTKTSPDGWVEETFPDGTVKTYRQQ